MRQPEAVFESDSNILLDHEVTPDDLRAILGMLAFAPASNEIAPYAASAPAEEPAQHPQDPEGNAPTPDTMTQSETTAGTLLQEPPEHASFEMPTLEYDLICLAQSDSPQAARAFGELFASKTYWLEAKLAGKIPNFDDRADVIQEVALKAFKAFRKYNVTRGTTFSSWILTIAHNAAVDFHRGASARPQPAPGIDPDRVFLSMEARDDVPAQALAPLGFRWILENVGKIEAETKGSGRDLVDLLTKIYVHGMSVNEYARHKGLPAGTVKSRLSHAYGLIKKFLPPDSRPITRKSI